MDSIPFFDLSGQIKSIKEELMHSISNVLDDGSFSSGKYVDLFEKEFAEYIGVKSFAGISSGSDALLLALRAMNLQPGDEVIVPANTFVATPFAVERLGARVVFADCDPITWEIDPDSVRSAVTDKTRGILCVHLYGQMCPMDELQTIAVENGLFLIEDCAQAQGAKYKGTKAGCFGEAGCFSFYPAKNLGACGEAGGVSGNDPKLVERIRLLRSQGSAKKYHHEELGYNMRMDGIQAAILSVKLRYLDAWNQRRADIISMYHKEICTDLIQWQGELPYTEPAWYLAVACVDNREKFLSYMERNNIICGVHYPVPCHLQKALYGLNYKKGDFPHVEWQTEHCVSLPLYPELSDEAAARVIEVCQKYSKG